MRILAISDAVSPVIYSSNFPANLPPFELVLSAGDMPGHVLEFIATRLTLQPIFVIGNHGNAWIYDPETGNKHLPGGCINAHGRVIEINGVLIAGLEGSARYRPGPHQYSEREMAFMAERLSPQLFWNKIKKGRAVDILLTHAPPKGQHEGTDYPHRGFAAFNRFAKRWRPKLHIHGHVHLIGSNAPREYLAETGTRVINAYEYTLIEQDFEVL
jgi:uncharacterized protein